MSLVPSTEAELADCVAGAEGPLAIRGGGTSGRGAIGPATSVSLAGLSGVSLYEPGALTLVVAAGTPLAEVEATLGEAHQRLAFEPGNLARLIGVEGAPTIGGVVAVNASGPRRVQAGACRDFLLGVRFVDGSGQVVTSGGRVMKNVTGYDLVKLLTGSHGTLGILSQVSLKVLPQPETRACLLIDGLEDTRAQEAMAAALGSPFEVSGAAHLPRGLDGTPVTMLRLEGFAESVAYRVKRLAAHLDAFGPQRIERDPEAVAKGWQWVRDVEAFVGQPGDVWRLSVKPSDGPVVAQAIGGQVIYDWAGGLIWALVPEGTDLRARLTGFAGHATLVRASLDTRQRLGTFQPEPPIVARLAAGLRSKFDPRGLFNPGLMA